MSKIIPIDKLIDTAFENEMNLNFNRIHNGEKLDINKKPFSIKLIDKLISFYEKTEDYEKCNIIYKFKEDLLNHEKNYLL